MVQTGIVCKSESGLPLVRCSHCFCDLVVPVAAPLVPTTGSVRKKRHRGKRGGSRKAKAAKTEPALGGTEAQEGKALLQSSTDIADGEDNPEDGAAANDVPTGLENSLETLRISENGIARLEEVPSKSGDMLIKRLDHATECFACLQDSNAS